MSFYDIIQALLRWLKNSSAFSAKMAQLYNSVYKPIKFFEKTVVGATVAHLGKKHIDTIKIFSCPDEMYRPFNAFLKKRQLLMNQNVSLIEARDRLLPKLMSGEIEV